MEDTFRSLTSALELKSVLLSLMNSTLVRMHVDLLSEHKKWLGHPQNLRLTIQHRSAPYGTRISRSTQLPTSIYSLSTPTDQIASTIVESDLLPLFNKLIDNSPQFDISLVNVAVVNIKPAPKTDISSYLEKRSQKVDGLTTVNSADETNKKRLKTSHLEASELEELGMMEILKDTDTERETFENSLDCDSEWEKSDYEPEYDDVDMRTCMVCKERVLAFTLEAHLRYHEKQD